MSFLCVFYAISSYKIARDYKEELFPHPSISIYTLSAIIFSLGAVALFFYSTLGGMVTCYAPMMPEGPPRKPSLAILGLALHKEKLLKEFRNKGVIEEKTYEKLIRKK